MKNITKLNDHKYCIKHNGAIEAHTSYYDNSYLSIIGFNILTSTNQLPARKNQFVNKMYKSYEN